jgi:hypothetical protein
MRLIARIFVFASSLFIILYGVLPGFFRVEGGFIPFYVAGKNFFNGFNPILFYRFPDFQKLIDASGLSTRIFSITGSTPASFLIGAIASIPPAGFSKFVLTAISLGAFVLLVHVSAKLARSSVKTTYMVFLSSSFALATNLRSGEPFIILTLFFVAAFFAFSINADRASGAILGMVFPFSVFTAIPALFFLLAKRWRVFIYFVLMSVFLISITYLVVGESLISYYLQHVFPFYFNGRIQNPFSISYQTAWSFLKRVLVFDPTLNPDPLLASRDVYVFLISLFKAVVVVPSAYFFYRGIEKKDTRESFVASAFPIVLLSPTAATFQLVLLAPAIVCLAQTALEEQRINTARSFIVLYALACLPFYSFMSNYMNVRTPFLLYERFFIVLSIYVIYLFFQLRLLPKHLLAVRMSITMAIVAAVTITLYMGESTPEPARAHLASPVLSGYQLRNASFSPSVYGNQFSFVALDSTTQNYAVHKPNSSLTKIDPPGNCYHVSSDESGRTFAVETTNGDTDVVNFTSEVGSKSYKGSVGFVNEDGDVGAFVNKGVLFIVDFQSKRIPIVDSINLLPFKIARYCFNNKNEILMVIDSLNGSNSIGAYNLFDHHLETRQLLIHVSLISADGDNIYMTSENSDSTGVWSQTGNASPVKLFAVHGNIIDMDAANHFLYFSSDFERGLGLPTIYKYRLKSE